MKTRSLLAAGILLAAHAGFAQDRLTLAPNLGQFVSVDRPVVALRNVQVIDGTGAPARPNQTILIEGGAIRQVGSASEVNVPEGAYVMDLAGHTVVPGFVGLHNHTFYMTSQRSIQLNYSAPLLYLASGVTTIRTTGSTAPYSELNLKQAIEAGERIGPRILVTGPYITGGTGFTTMTRVDTPEDARRVVRYWAEEGVSWMKAYTRISHDALAATIDEAHKHGMKVTGHLCSVSFREAVAMGIDNLEHGYFTNTDYDPGKEKDLCPDGFENRLLDVDLEGDAVKQTFSEMIAAGVPMTSTLAVYEMYVPGRPPADQRTLDAMSPDVREEYRKTYESISKLADDPNYPFTEALFQKALAYEYAFAKAGGLLASGVDPTGYGGALPGYGDQRNYELLLEAGFTPEEVIQIMTSNGAKVLGLDDRIGTIAPGKLAELVVIEGNPVAIPEAIRNVKIVFKDGYGFDSAAIVGAVNGVVGVR
jgi:imidazolonepropionase-like amidohydrolase